MSNSKIIVVEGPQGVGKTTITDFIRNTLPYTNLYRLNGTSDSSPTGFEKSKKMYMGLIEYIKTLENANINLLFDRTFFTEEIYCRLGFKEYSYTSLFNELLTKLCSLDFEFYYITLYLSDENQYEERLKRDGKANVKYAKFSLENSIIQQKAYLELADEVKKNYPKINVYKIDASKSLIKVEDEIKEILKINP